MSSTLTLTLQDAIDVAYVILGHLCGGERVPGGYWWTAHGSKGDWWSTDGQDGGRSKRQRGGGSRYSWLV
jgi:hypothetical protein